MVFYGDVGAAEWASFMDPAMEAYGAAWTADHPGSRRRLGEGRRRLSFGSWAAGKVGGWFGGSVGGSVGSSLGSAAGHMAMGESAGDALGMAGATDAEVFAETRRRKDAF